MIGSGVGRSWAVAIVAVAFAASASAAGRHHPAAGPVAVPAHGGPFGIVMGAPLATVGPVKDIGGGMYIVQRPPISNDEIEGVAVEGFADIGICRIMGVSRQLVGDSSGAQAKHLVDNLAADLAAKYGPFSSKVDSCSDSAGCDTGWLGEVQDHQAQYGYNWHLADQRRSDGLTGIALRVKADDAFTSRAEVLYFGFDENACAREADAASSHGL